MCLFLSRLVQNLSNGKKYTSFQMTNFWTKFETSAYHKIKVASKTEFVLEMEKKHCWKRRKAMQDFLLVPQCYKKDDSLGSLEIGIVWYVKSLDELLRNRIDSTGSIGNMAVPLGMLLQYPSFW